jgi:hypothetical protein
MDGCICAEYASRQLLNVQTLLGIVNSPPMFERWERRSVIRRGQQSEHVLNRNENERTKPLVLGSFNVTLVLIRTRFRHPHRLERWNQRDFVHVRVRTPSSPRIVCTQIILGRRVALLAPVIHDLKDTLWCQLKRRGKIRQGFTSGVAYADNVVARWEGGVTVQSGEGKQPFRKLLQ